jgi:DNA topoisomerase-6 subunit A
MGAAGGAVPASVEPENFKFKKCTADYILVVEKYAVWNLLNQQRYWEKNNCILMTGKGQPARAERRLVARFEKELKLPIYVFCDMDIYGAYIYSVYKQGSINLAFFSEKAAAPSAKYIGFNVDDYVKFKLPKTALIKMHDDDLKRIKEVKAYDWFKSKDWQEELTKLEKFGYTIESDALVAKSIDFTAKVYLPTKIKNKAWLD